MGIELRTSKASRRHTMLGPGLLATFFICFLYVLFMRWENSHPIERAAVFVDESTAWKYDVARDSDNYGLTDEQCTLAFPKLFRPIEASMARLEDGILQANTTGFSHWGESRVLIYDNAIYILEDFPDDISINRKISTLHAINRAILAVASTGHRFPNIEFSLAAQDRNADLSRPNWAYDRAFTDNLTVLIPDFGLYSWPAHNVGTYPEVRSKIKAVERNLKFEDKIPKLAWRGSLNFGSGPRSALVKATNGKLWSAVEGIDWLAPDYKEHVLTMQDHCKYQFLAHTEGLAYSGRLKYLHNCESVIIAHEFEYETHDQHLMIDSGPDQNYVLFKRDYSDLDEKMDWLLANPEEAARIARNNAAVFRDRYLTPAAEACYWRRLIHEWANNSNFEPRFYKDGTDEWRGVPYENYALERSLHWDEQEVG